MFYDEILKEIQKQTFKSVVSKYKNTSKYNALVHVAEDSEKALNSVIENANVITVNDSTNYISILFDLLSLEDFKDIKFPFDNMFIEIQPPKETLNNIKDMKVGIHIFSDNAMLLKSTNDYNLVIYIGDKRLNKIDAIAVQLKLNKLPRFYIACPTKCNSMINPQSFGKNTNSVLCMRNEKTCMNCNIGRVAYQSLLTAMYTIMLMSDPVVEIVQENKPWKKSNSNNKKRNKEGQKYIYINPIKKVYQKHEDTEHVKIERGSPIPHERRGHWRHYKSGKKVWINQMHVQGKGKSKKDKNVYKITL